MKRPLSLSSPRDFRRVMSDGRVFRRHWATIHVTPGLDPTSPSRLGLAVSARSGGAVQRNRIKRRVRAAFRHAAPVEGLDVVVRAREGAVGVEYQEMEETLRGLTV